MSDILKEIRVGNSIELRIPYTDNLFEIESRIYELLIELGFNKVSERNYILGNDCIVIRPSSNMNEVSINVNTCEQFMLDRLTELLRREFNI